MRYTTAGKALTDLILEVFRVNGDLLRVGDGLARPEGQTSSRWQVLGAIADAPKPVAGIARDMGLTRQSVQRTADLLETQGLVEYADNPAHRRARLVRPTPAGARVLDGITRRQVEWANRLARAMSTDEQGIRDSLAVLHQVRAQLDHPVEPRASTSPRTGRKEAR
jgi:DNA-binding MarR family transcriptional regulator